MDVLLALATIAAVAYYVWWEDYIKPALGLDKPPRVRNSPPLPAYRARSARSARSNVLNAGSGQQDAAVASSNVQNVLPPGAAAAAAIAAPGGDVSPSDHLTLTPRELQQLANAITARAAGSTVEEALYQGFSVRKGGSAGYKRAKELFDTATKAP
jgi:hypothetical protein